MQILTCGLVLASSFVLVACDDGSPTETTDPDGSFSATLSGEVNATITDGHATFASSTGGSGLGFVLSLGDDAGDYVIGVTRDAPGRLAEGAHTISGDLVAWLGGNEVGLIYDLDGATLTVTTSSSTTLVGTIVGTGRFTGADNVEREIDVNGSFTAVCAASGGCP